MDEMIRRWVSRDPTGYGYLLDFYRRGARVCLLREDALVLMNDALGVCYAGGGFADVPELRNATLTMVEDRALSEALLAEGAYQQRMVCRQAYYPHAERPPHRSDLTVRPLTGDDLAFVLHHYHHPGAYEAHIRGRIREGMLGAEVEGRLAGFIGLHQEGCIGLLEVLPEYRRRGVAEALETAMIRRQLEQGRWPYVHVTVGNTPSERLQEKVGMVFDDRRRMYWLCPD